MKQAEFNLHSSKGEFYNSLFGMERVLIDSNEVSKKFSFMGTAHKFQLGTKNFQLRSQFQPFEKKEVTIRIIEDGKLIETKIVSLNKKQKVFWIGFGIITGISAYQLVEYLFGIMIG